MNNLQLDAENAINQLVNKGIKLPPQPGVLIELQKMFASDGYNMSSLARIISSDPGITAMLFKTARSPVFSSGKEFHSVEQVLMLIGIKQTYNLVQAISLSTSISDATRKSFEIFWTRSQEVANIAALIAGDRVSVCNIFPDQAYMAGIFYECGVPVLMQRFPDYCNKLNIDNNACWPILAEEDAIFNVDHCSIGYLVAHHWKLPDFICKAILSRNEIPHEALGAVRSLVAILQLSIHIYHRISHTDHPHWWKIRAEVLEELGIHPDSALEYYEEITEQFLAA
jgi:HD-like signal output (HDOD) protein